MGGTTVHAGIVAQWFEIIGVNLGQLISVRS